MKTLGILIFFLFVGMTAHAQTGCQAKGQSPATAFPVCGTSVFEQKKVPICTNSLLSVPGCSDNAGYADKNPFWYKFTCYRSGTLDFLIEPNDQGDDYDWQLYDITGHDPSDVYSNTRLIVAGNWAGTYGNTGATPNGVTYTQCASNPLDNEPSFARSPQLKAGHHYLLMVSHYTNTQSGYSLSFNGGTAVITDTLLPELGKAQPGCDATTVAITLNKKMNCSSLAADGSDFVISPAVAKVVAAASTDCNNGFDMDSLTITLDKALPPGDYTVTIRNGTDQNTLSDNCGNEIPVGDKLDFTVQKIAPTPIDSIVPPGCAPKTIQVVFDGPMRCNSFAADGSDFTITGPSAVTVTGAKGVNCTDNASTVVALTLAQPIVVGGQYTLRMRLGSDGNTVINACAVESPPDEIMTFQTSDTVNAHFSRTEQYSCNLATVSLHHPGDNGINTWRWTTGTGLTDSTPDLEYRDTLFNDQQVSLKVSNGVCTDSTSETFPLNSDYFIRAYFEKPSFVCPNDEATFVDHSRGNVDSYLWDFGNGQTSFLKVPPRQQYPEVVTTKDFPIMLVVGNNVGCKDTAVQQLKVINNCYIAVPTAFTPNGDGVNDYLYPLNAYKARDLDFRVYNRYGQMVFRTKEWTVKWDGTFQGKPQPMGSYVWMLSYVDSDTGIKMFKKGATLLIR